MWVTGRSPAPGNEYKKAMKGRTSLPKPQWNIAIDGPAGAGKSTVARLLAARLGYRYIDTGALYRALTLYILRCGLDPADEEKVAQKIKEARLETELSADGTRVFLDKEDVTDALRQPIVNQHVSQIAQQPAVREQLLLLQRQMAEGGGVVMDGRDIGTVVLPQAELKIFLTATPEERAGRRVKELRAQGHRVTWEEVVRSIIARDKVDSERKIAPLRAAPDAIRVDTTGKDVETVVNEILKHFVARGGVGKCFTGVSEASSD